MTQLIALACIAMLFPVPSLSQKKGGKKKTAPPVETQVAQRIEKVRGRLGVTPLADETGRTLERIAGRLLEDAGARLRAGQLAESDQLARGAEALARAIDHLRHASDPARAKGLSREEQTVRLEKAYFRLQQGEYFAEHTPDALAKELSAVARRLYQRARQAFDGGNSLEVDEFTKASGEVVKCIEHLARLALPLRTAPRLE